MDVRKLLLLVAALLVAGITAAVARSMFARTSVATATAALPSGPQILVATRALPLGTIITAEMLVFQPWPKDLLDQAYFLKGSSDPTKLVGQVVRTDIAAGQPVPQGALVGPGERGFLAAALSPGMRAITVSVTDTTGVGGFVFPGDRVDMVLTQEVPGDGRPLRVSETIIRNVRVLAIDQVIDNSKTEPRVGRTVTLELTPKLAEKVAVAQSIGTLALVLRSLAETPAELDRAIAAGEIAVPENQTSAADRAMELALARMPSDANPTFTTGGEVSRFQRSSAPADPQRSFTPVQLPAAPAGHVVTTPPRPRAPVVRIARGDQVTDVALEAY